MYVTTGVIQRKEVLIYCRRKYNNGQSKGTVLTGVVFLFIEISLSPISIITFVPWKKITTVNQLHDRSRRRPNWEEALLRVETVYQPFGTLAAVWRRWFIPLTNNVDFGAGSGSIDFQKALACSIVSAELPANITVDTSAILFLSFPGMHGKRLAKHTRTTDQPQTNHRCFLVKTCIVKMGLTAPLRGKNWSRY